MSETNVTTTVAVTLVTTPAPPPPGYVYVPPPEWAINLAYSLSTVELGLHSVLVVVALLNTAVLWRTAVLHPNLRALLIGQSATIIVYELGRLCIVAQKFTTSNIFNRLFILLIFVFILIN
jgi:hypothetical protein